MEKRILSNSEVSKIKTYKLMPSIESVVMDLWSQKPATVKFPSPFKKAISNFIGLLVWIFLAVLIWVKYLSTAGYEFILNNHIGGLFNISIFMIWVIMLIFLLVFLLQMLAWLHQDSPEKFFEAWVLDIWKPRNAINRFFMSLFNLIVIIGLILNGYFILVGFMLLLSLITYLRRMYIREEVNKAMKTYLE